MQRIQQSSSPGAIDSRGGMLGTYNESHNAETALQHTPEHTHSEATSPAQVGPVSEKSSSPDLVALLGERTDGTSLERFHVAMSFVAVFFVMAAALLYQGAATGAGSPMFFIAGLVSVGAAIATFAAARHTLVKQLQSVAIELGQSSKEARKSARHAFRNLWRAFDRSMGR